MQGLQAKLPFFLTRTKRWLHPLKDDLTINKPSLRKKLAVFDK